MNKVILDDISVRFFLLIPQEDKKYQERIFFLLEEAYWFFIDFYPSNEKISLKTFGEKILRHNNIKYKDDDFKEFQRYKKQIPVYGALIFNQFFDKILLVRDESPIDCAIRETYEEIGYEIDEKVIDDGIKISERFVIFPVFNVKENTVFETKTRNEIRSINWIGISEIEEQEREDLRQIRMVYNKVRPYVNKKTETRFRFDVSKIESIFDSVKI
ncbi:mRNA-decapping enzyme subunit 2 [Binucleata daphniae]